MLLEILPGLLPEEVLHTLQMTQSARTSIAGKMFLPAVKASSLRAARLSVSVQTSRAICAVALQASPGSYDNFLVTAVWLDGTIKQSHACRCMSLSSRSSGYQFCARLCQPGLGRGAASNDDDSSPTPGGHETFVLRECHILWRRSHPTLSRP